MLIYFIPLVLGLLTAISSNLGALNQSSEPCAICLEPFGEEFNSKFVTQCGHAFCENCLVTQQSLAAQGPNLCPLCRQAITNLRSMDEENEQAHLPKPSNMLELFLGGQGEWTPHGYQ